MVSSPAPRPWRQQSRLAGRQASQEFSIPRSPSPPAVRYAGTPPHAGPLPEAVSRTPRSRRGAPPFPRTSSTSARPSPPDTGAPTLVESSSLSLTTTGRVVLHTAALFLEAPLRTARPPAPTLREGPPRCLLRSSRLVCLAPRLLCRPPRSSSRVRRLPAAAPEVPGEEPQPAELQRWWFQQERVPSRQGRSRRQTSVRAE